MGKRNKIRYQSKLKPRIPITLSGRIYLQYRDEESIAQAAKGDLLVYAQNEALHTTQQGNYDATGYSGYFKVDVHDSFRWQPVILVDIFTDQQHYFSKSECPIDTYAICYEILKALAGKTLVRTYREHYALEEVSE